MPGFDRTGPLGRGAMTGRGLGYCRQAVPVNETPDTVPAPGQGVPPAPDNPNQPVIYGRGRGGVPCGCGRGFGGGGMRGRRFRN